MAKILRSSIQYKQPRAENLVHFIQDNLNKHSDRTLIIDSNSNTTWTGRQLYSIVSALSKHLVDVCGLCKGDVCSLYYEESDTSAILILAIVTSGGVCNFLTTSSSGRQVRDTAQVLGSKFLFSSRDLLAKIQADLLSIDDTIRVVSIDDQCDGFKHGCRTIGHLLSQSSSLQSISGQCSREVSIDPETDYALIQFSSGTTGKPKPIPRTHKNLCHLVASVNHSDLMDLRPGVVLAGSLPMTHRPGIWALLACIENGSTLVIWNNLSDVEDALAMIEKYKVTIFASSLPFLSMLGSSGPKMKSRFDTSSWQHIITAGAKIVNPDLPKSLIREFNLRSLRQCFGMTEAGWCFLIEQSQAADNYLSVGHVVPGMEAVVLDRESERPLEAYARGEVALRGPQVFPGYLTGESGLLNRSDFTADGWFKTGDQGYYDKDDLVFIEGRYKEIMMFENNCLYFPNEIEAVISDHPSIEGVCVVKVAEVRVDYPYDVARACVTLKHGFNVTEREILDFVHEQCPQVILGGGVRILDQFPRLQNGKVDKQILQR